MKLLDYRSKEEAKRNLHELASDVGDLFGLLVNWQRAVSIHIKQVLADQVLVVDESWTADHLSSCCFCCCSCCCFISHLCEVVAQVDKGVEAGDDGDEVDEEGEEAPEEGEDKSVPCSLAPGPVR